MPPKKKKASGDAAKGEKVFKNLCGVCHSLSVSINFKTHGVKFLRFLGAYQSSRRKNVDVPFSKNMSD